jgi:hypothetical protein
MREQGNSGGGSMTRVCVCVCGVALAAALTASGGAAAATMQQAMAQCKEKFTPPIRDCVRQKMAGQRNASPEQYIPGCKAQFMGQIRACVVGLMGAAGLANNKGFTDEKGELLFAYAHPLFWAPYTVIGDGC